MVMGSRWRLALAGLVLLAADGRCTGQEDYRRRANARDFDLVFYPVATAIAPNGAVWRPSPSEGARRLRSRLDDALFTRAGNDAYANRFAPAGERKLRLAGRHDISRFFRWVDSRRAEFERMEWPTRDARDYLQRVVRERDQRIEAMFQDDSLYAKVLNALAAECSGEAIVPRDAEAAGR
jgi:hypothetical protein